VRELPAQVRLAIDELFGPPIDLIKGRNSDEKTRLRARKLGKIRFFEDYFISRRVALAGIRLVLQNKLPFCLFLRSYLMGHHTHNFSSAGGVLDVSEPSGGRLLRQLSEILGEKACIITISNPDEWLPHRLIPGPFANLVVGQTDWQKVVKTLIGAAQLIVIHRAGTSPGLDFELDCIREARRETSTAVVREPEFPNENQPPKDTTWLSAAINSMKLKDRFRRTSSTEGGVDYPFPPDPALEGLSVLEWSDDKTLRTQLASFAKLQMTRHVQRQYAPLPSIDAGLPKVEEEKFIQMSRQAYDTAAMYIRSGDLYAGEESLFECLGFSCLGIDTAGRATAYLELGRLYLLRTQEYSLALVPLEYASGHFMVMNAKEYAFEALCMYSAAKLLGGELDGAKFVSERALGFRLKKEQKEWQRRFWNKIGGIYATPNVTRFIVDLGLSEHR